MQPFGGNHNLESEQRRKLRKDALFYQSSTFDDKPPWAEKFKGERVDAGFNRYQ